MKVINLFAGPGSGKSTTAAGLFYHMKLEGFSVELVTEYAKELHYDGVSLAPDSANQLRIFHEQWKRIDRLVKHVEWAIVDSPLLFSYVYCPEADWLDKHVKPTFDMYDNYNFFLNRPHPDNVKYQPEGRYQDLEGALIIDRNLKDLLYRLNVPYTEVGVSKNTIDIIIRHLNSTMK